MKRQIQAENALIMSYHCNALCGWCTKSNEREICESNVTGAYKPPGVFCPILNNHFAEQQPCPEGPSKSSRWSTARRRLPCWKKGSLNSPSQLHWQKNVNRHPVSSPRKRPCVRTWQDLIGKYDWVMCLAIWAKSFKYWSLDMCMRDSRGLGQTMHLLESSIRAPRAVLNVSVVNLYTLLGPLEI